MAVRSNHNQKGCSYFCTFTCFSWLPLFEITDSYDFIYSWFDRLIREKNQILGFVIMPNHLHFLIFIPETGTRLNKLMGEGKRFMAYHIVKELKLRDKLSILHELEDDVEAGEKKRGKLHEVFESSFDAKECYTLKFIEQKLDYIHSNPVSGKWKLANSFTDYKYSSATFYELNKPCRIEITHYMDAGISPSPAPSHKSTSGDSART